MIFQQLRSVPMATSIRYVAYASGASGNSVALTATTRKDLTVPDLSGAPTFFLQVANPAGSSATVYVIPSGGAQTTSGTVVTAGSSVQVGPFRVDDCPSLIATANVTVTLSVLAVVSEG